MLVLPVKAVPVMHHLIYKVFIGLIYAFLVLSFIYILSVCRSPCVMMMMMMIFEVYTCFALLSSSVFGHTGGPSFFLYPNNEITLASPFPVDQFLPLFKKYGGKNTFATHIR
jgi:hypothetical protein